MKRWEYPIYIIFSGEMKHVSTDTERRGEFKLILNAVRAAEICIFMAPSGWIDETRVRRCIQGARA